VLRQSPAGGGDVELVNELVQYLEAEDAMIDGGLEELGNVVGQFAVGLVVEPPELGDAANELDEGGNDEVLEGRALVGQVAQDVVAYVDPLGHGEVVPVGGDELREGVGRDEAGIVRLGVVEDVLALGDVVRRRLEAEEAGLRLGPRDGLAGFRRAGGPRVEGLAQRFDLRELLLVHGVGLAFGPTCNDRVSTNKCKPWAGKTGSSFQHTEEDGRSKKECGVRVVPMGVGGGRNYHSKLTLPLLCHLTYARDGFLLYQPSLCNG